jgi:hypothetical protein
MRLRIKSTTGKLISSLPFAVLMVILLMSTSAFAQQAAER